MKTFKSIIENEAKQPYYQALHEFVEAEYASKTIFPPHNHILHAFNFCDYEDIKVVIIGQDPYHELHQANGLAFSVNKGVRIPPSLVNIYKEAHNDVGIDIPNHGDLTAWAKQGVLLLNTVLTVQEGRANSHKGKGWEQLTDAVIKKLNERNVPTAFILWGGNAKAKAPLITNPIHAVFKAAHPSPLSAYNGFFGCRHFSKANDFLVRNGMTPVDWQL